MSAYRIRILRPNAAARLRLQPVMHGMAGLLFLFNAIGIYNSRQPGWGMILYFLAVGLASLLFPFIMRRFSNFSGANSLMRIVQVFVCFSACLYFLAHMKPLIGILQLLVGLGMAYIGWVEYNILKPVYVLMDITGITLPATFSSRTVAWNQLNNVVLRNDLLTIDFKNNKILQLEVLDDIPGIKEDEINGFCRSRLAI
ncbi:hypothetical protein [Chitinophaga japonensis]|uniref:Uncharacterized protein n=1 Tax=Chitinophaga japonensis TaxID=104662 RepID=A0A562T7N3_CHIJA|nr:hypothetical protein [Chitinophaga japonensis]TWI89184.1 hypothetical protein LX66_3278 [Chitinophaga japonensis]